MKKFILPLLLLLAIGMLAAVESDPSAVVGYVKYHCEPGINMIALPMDMPLGYTCGNFADNYPGMISDMSYWDYDNQQWVAASDWGYWEGDFEVTPGLPMMITATGTFDAYSIGAMPAVNATYAMDAGINTIMIPLNKGDMNPLVNPDMVSDFSEDIGAGLLSDVSYWDYDNQQWVAASDWGYWEGDFEVGIAMPLMVTATGPTVWPSRNARVSQPSVKANKTSRN
jgi:hypothetical protein